jgi:hypothetical protein
VRAGLDPITEYQVAIRYATNGSESRERITFRGLPIPESVNHAGRTTNFFGHVTSVRLARLETDGVLKHVGRLTQLERLTISVRAISDAELAPLQALNNLSFLDLSKLSHLQLFATQASCAGVQELKQAVPGLVIVR